MLNTCIPVVLAAKPAVQLAARVVQRVTRRVVGHGRRPSNTAAHAKLAAPKAVQAPAVCVKGAGLAAMKAAAVAGWLGTAGAAGYAAADVAAGGAPAAVAAPGLASGVAPAAVGPTAAARQAPASAASFGAAPFGAAMRAMPAPSASGAPAAPETAAQPTTPIVSDALALAPEDRAPGEAPQRHLLPDSVPGSFGPRAPVVLPLSAPAATQVAEPGSLVLLAAGLLCFAASRARSRHRV